LEIIDPDRHFLNRPELLIILTILPKGNVTNISRPKC
jgi:hypothetical protein